jgi:putative phosphoribosyl transferase
VVDGEQTDIVLNEDVVAASDIGPAALQKLAQEELGEIERRRKVYLRGRTSMSVAGRSAIVVDDGIATGASVRAALTAVRRRSPKRLVLAVPVAPTETLVALRPLVDDLLCLATPEPFDAIGAHYRDFHQLTDREVVEMLNQAPAEENAGAA